MSISPEIETGVAQLELNHGKANEMGSVELDRFEAMVDELVQANVRVLITYSRRVSKRGTPIFIAGANVTERVGWSADQVRAHVRRQRAVLAKLRHAPFFHIAVVNGVALGWGTEYLIACDYRVAAADAVFGLPETGLGIIPGAGGSSELSSMIGLSQALRLGMTGERISAGEAERIGLVQEVAADVDAGLERALALAAMVSKKSPTAIAAFKSAALAGVGQPPEVRREIEAQAYEHCLETGEAAIGRAHFSEIRKGADVPWGPLVPFATRS